MENLHIPLMDLSSRTRIDLVISEIETDPGETEESEDDS
jgi:hypothetical protein